MLRDYQQRALEEIRGLYSKNIRRVFLHMPTGSGKTVVFCEVLKGVAAKQMRAVMVVRGRKLVDQASKRLDREGVDHGVLMAGHWRGRPNAKIQICSIDTLYERRLSPLADLVVIDEAHQATSKGYMWLAEAYATSFFLPVSATPYCKKSLRHIADRIIKPIGIQQLIAQGYLVPPVCFAPTIPDLSGVKTNSSGDYDVEALDDLMNKNHPIGDIVENWKIFAENRPTLLFAVSVNHSESVATALNAAGISAVSVDAGNSDKERDEAIAALESGAVKVVCNVGIFCTGVDIPAVSCLVMARPTKSYALYVQQMGRGTRIAPGKTNFRVIDHAGNVMRHGSVLEEREGSLDPMPKTSRDAPSACVTCDSCYAVYGRDEQQCPSCGETNPSPADIKTEKALNPLDGELSEVDAFHLKVIARRGALKDIAKRKGYVRGWIYHQLSREFGVDIAKKYQKQVPDWVRKSRSASS